MVNLLRKRTKKYLEKSLKGQELFNHLVEEGYFPEAWVLPSFLQVKLKTAGNGDTTTREKISLFAPKSNMRWREFSLLHPNNYQDVCQKLSKKEYFKIISKLSKGSKIFGYSVPLGFKDRTERIENQIREWSELQEDLMNHIYEYPFILIADISNCYHSMYTHAIEWACEKAGYKTYGTELDKSIRRGMNNRTHGLPVGPAITDYVAEIVLYAIDREIEKELKDKNYIAGRFRDDYFFLCKTKAEAEDILKGVAVCLRIYHQSINTEKIRIVESNFYFNNFWRIDFQLLVQQFGFENLDKRTIKVNTRKLESFIGLVLRLSSSLNHERAVIELALDLLLKIRPDSKKAYPRYFNLVTRMYQGRIPALSRILLLLFELANESQECDVKFKQFLLNRFQVASNLYDEFEVLWIVYFMSQKQYKYRDGNNIYKTLERSGFILSKIIVSYYKSALSNRRRNGDLTNKLYNTNNNSKMNIVYSDIRSLEETVKLLHIKLFY